jgi:hypothetical protein
MSATVLARAIERGGCAPNAAAGCRSGTMAGRSHPRVDCASFAAPRAGKNPGTALGTDLPQVAQKSPHEMGISLTHRKDRP